LQTKISSKEIAIQAVITKCQPMSSITTNA